MTLEKEVTPSGTSTVLAIIANRFSFVFNLKGPNFVCDTACSASLTSTHCARFMISRPADFRRAPRDISYMYMYIYIYFI